MAKKKPKHNIQTKENSQHPNVVYRSASRHCSSFKILLEWNTSRQCEWLYWRCEDQAWVVVVREFHWVIQENRKRKKTQKWYIWPVQHLSAESLNRCNRSPGLLAPGMIAETSALGQVFSAAAVTFAAVWSVFGHRFQNEPCSGCHLKIVDK